MYVDYLFDLCVLIVLFLQEEGGDLPFIPYDFVRPTIQKTRIEVASFPPPTYDCLQYTSTTEEDLGDLVTCGYIR